MLQALHTLGVQTEHIQQLSVHYTSLKKKKKDFKMLPSFLRFKWKVSMQCANVFAPIQAVMDKKTAML